MKSLCLLTGIIIILAYGEALPMDFCGYQFGAIHKGMIALDDAYILERFEGLRSKGECATHCYEETYCMTAVFEADGDCLLIRNFTDAFTLIPAPTSSVLSDFVLEMQTKDPSLSRGANNLEVENLACPSTCSGYSICFLDCSADVDPEPMCMDITTDQYTTDSCQFEPYIQVKEYYLANLDRDLHHSHGNRQTYFTVTFNKLKDWTTLRVKFRATLRGGYGHNWGRWQFWFNGGNCGNPGYIESLNYEQESNTDHQKATGIHGVCHGLSAGTVSIALIAELHNTWFRVGYATHASRLYVEELGHGDWDNKGQHACPSLPVYNLRQHITTSEWSNDHSATLWNVAFRKMESGTMLRINLDFMMRLYMYGNRQNNCVTWYVKIDGNHCQPQPLGKTVAHLGYGYYINNEHRSGEIEGHCSGISAGDHTISLYVHTCPWGQSSGDVHTGWNGCRQRFIIEEYHAGSNIAAVMSSDGDTLYRVPQFNMVNHAWGHPASGTDSGWISTVTMSTYVKNYENSGLQLLMSADGRNIRGNAGCCRHYFVINGAECSDPGTIEGIHYINHAHINLHRPILIEGICEGVPAGNVDVKVYAGYCKGYSSVGDCYFGWNSYVHILISESFVEREIVQF